MKRAYYIHYTMDFANTYNLYWAPMDSEVPEGLERISRKEAERKCAEERYARKYDQAFSGYGSTVILPVSAYGKLVNMIDQIDGYIAEENQIECEEREVW